MRPIRKILVPVDFSPCSGRALAHALDLAMQLGAEVEILHVAEVPSGFEAGLVVHEHASASFQDSARQTATRALSVFVESIPNTRAVRIAKKIDLGSPRERILEQVRREKYDLIVIGTHGTSGRLHGLVGDVTQVLVRDAACPVLTVGAVDSSHAAPTNMGQ